MRGQYQYRLGGTPVSIHESFELTGSPGAWERFRSHRHVPDAGVELFSEGRMRDRTVTALSLRRRAGAEEHRAAFHFEDEPLLAEKSEVLPAGALLGGVLRISMGMTLGAILARGGSAQVMTPSLSPPWFELVASRRTARVIRVEESPGEGEITVVEYAGGVYDPPCRCRIDQDGVLAGYGWDQPGVGRWEVARELDLP